MIEGVHVHRLPVAFEVKLRPWLLKMEETISRIGPDVLFVHGTGSPAAFPRCPACPASRTADADGQPYGLFQPQPAASRGHLLPAAPVSLPAIVGQGNIQVPGRGGRVLRLPCERAGHRSRAIECLPLAVDTDLFQPDGQTRATTRRRFGLPETATVVLQTGKLAPRKAPHLLAEAVAPLLKDNAQLHLVFVGGGDEEYLSRVRAPAESLGVPGQVHFIPLVPVTELAAVYSMADIAVYPAGTSLSCLEAAACELPVIMTDLPASRWRAEHGVGVCYESGNVDDLRARIQRLVQDKCCGRRWAGTAGPQS